MEFTVPPRIKPGDKVAIVSPSSGLASIFPWVYELGLKRLRDIFQLEPVPFPSALKSPEYLEKNPEARAEDINQAFKDPSIKAIIATIGGNDQIRILPYLDKKVIGENPKAFFGYSDNTNLHLFLWNLKIVSYYGGNLMNQFAMQGKMHDFTVRYLKKALFEKTIGLIHSSPEWTDYDFDWADPKNLTRERPHRKSDGWVWENHEGKKVEGRLFGGCLETLAEHLSTKSYLPNIEKFQNAVLYLETSEEMPTDEFVYHFVKTLGVMGILGKICALLIGYPKTQFCGKSALIGMEQYQMNQQAAIKKGLKEFNASPLVVFNLNFGHTDPQLIIPNGGIARIDGNQKTIQLDTSEA